MSESVRRRDANTSIDDGSAGVDEAAEQAAITVPADCPESVADPDDRERYAAARTAQRHDLDDAG